MLSVNSRVPTITIPTQPKKMLRGRNTGSARGISKGGVKLPKQDIRDLHRDAQFEIYEDLLDQRFKITSQVVALRVEIDELTKELERLEQMHAEQEEVEIADKRRHGGREQDGDAQEQVLINTAKLRELEEENESLAAQFNFVSSLFGAPEEESLKNYVGLQSHAHAEVRDDIASIQSQIEEKREAIVAPDLDQRRHEVRKNAKKIRRLTKRLEAMKKEEKALMDEFGKQIGANENKKREMQGEVVKLKHQLEVAKHRKATRQKEISEYERTAQKQKTAFGDIGSVKRSEDRKTQERERFRKSMKKKIDDEMEAARKELHGDENTDSQPPLDKDSQPPGEKDSQPPLDKDPQTPLDKDSQTPLDKEPQLDDVFHITQHQKLYEEEETMENTNTQGNHDLSPSETSESSSSSSSSSDKDDFMQDDSDDEEKKQTNSESKSDASDSGSGDLLTRLGFGGDDQSQNTRSDGFEDDFDES